MTVAKDWDCEKKGPKLDWWQKHTHIYTSCLSCSHTLWLPDTAFSPNPQSLERKWPKKQFKALGGSCEAWGKGQAFFPWIWLICGLMVSDGDTWPLPWLQAICQRVCNVTPERENHSLQSYSCLCWQHEYVHVCVCDCNWSSTIMFKWWCWLFFSFLYWNVSFPAFDCSSCVCVCQNY